VKRVAWIVLALVFALAATPLGHSKSKSSSTNQVNKTVTKGVKADKDADWTKASSGRSRSIDSTKR
jgi:hypothetical protein